MDTKIKCLFLIFLGFTIGCKKEASPVTNQSVNSKPVINILTPLNDATIYDSTFIDIQATDDKGITKVKLYIDNQIVQTFITSPFRYLWSIDSWQDSTTHLIYAEAYDADNNISSSTNVLVTIFKVKPTNLQITSMYEDQVSMKWTDNCKIEIEYVVEFSLDSGTTYTVLKHLPSNSTNATIASTFLFNKKYYFRVGTKLITSILYSEQVNKIIVAPVVFPVSKISYNSHVQPLFNTNCVTSGCHDVITKAGNLDLSNYIGIKQRYYDVVIPKDTVASRLIWSIEGRSGNALMPPSRSLNSNQIVGLKQWIMEGATDTIP